jgi:hypothetical protein
VIMLATVPGVVSTVRAARSDSGMVAGELG